MAGINDDPIKFTPTQMAEGIATARTLLETQRRRDQAALFAAYGSSGDR
jgi:hypothetical protein